jgi:SAM-dependent methyltransferase
MASSEQEQLWNGSSGQAWVESQELLDQVFFPFETLLVEAAAARSPRRLLDVGCGTGSTTLAIARRLGTGARCGGLDISEPMLALARARAQREGSRAEFIRADAQTYAFEPATVDMIVSRFGVMFFDDPVAAFANLRRAATADVALRLIAWRGAAENPFMTTAERAAAALLPELPPRNPDGPGQFAFADAKRVHAILEASGWTGADVRPIDVECAFPAAQLDTYLTRLGPVGRVLQEADEPTRARIMQTIRPAFDPYLRGADVRFVAACWMLSAG